MLFLRSVAPPVQKSPVVFQKYADNYIHTFTQQSDTGLEMDLLQKYIFIPLDIFKENVENKGIKNKMDGWLTFLGMDEPEKIIELINTYPEFREMYEHVYYICRNVEDVMGIFSEELRGLHKKNGRSVWTDAGDDRRAEGNDSGTARTVEEGQRDAENDIGKGRKDERKRTHY